MSPRRSALLGLGAALLAAGAIAAVYGLRDGLLTLALLAAVGAAALALAHVARARRRRLGTPRRQLALGIAIAVGQLVLVIGAGIALMFVSAHDALFVGAITAFAVVIAIRAVQLMSGGVMDDAERMRRDLIAAVSHDLRTPITSLRLLTEAIADDVVDGATRRSYLGQMSTHLNAMSALIDDLFELSRLEAGEINWSLEQVQLDELVGETVDAMRAQADARSVQVRAELPAGLRPAHGDPEKLQRVLFNLIQNAIRHTPADGSVVVRAAAGGRRRRDRGVRHGRRDRGRRARARLRAVLPRRRASRAAERRRRPRPGDLARDRRGPRRPHLARGRAERHARALFAAVCVRASLRTDGRSAALATSPRRSRPARLEARLRP